MTDVVLSSTLLLTGLLVVGLVFFIRASAKDRTQTVAFASSQTADELQQQLTDYFEQRAYQRRDRSGAQPVQMIGQVRPSVFLAVFLSLLAAVGLLCLALVLLIALPAAGKLPLALTLLAPLAPIFYWRRAGREETIAFETESLNAADRSQAQNSLNSKVTFTGHRDEAIQLAANLPLKQWEEAA
ncbi:MAG: cofactor assembly of complex C subunit B [Leptolyngbya sp. SIO4C1]|nr:cofactor assembly of complex C subunit B [Leptolyngbya sp. SIO4C1]